MKNVLIIEDDYIMLKAIRNILSRGGYNALMAKDGKEAFELLDNADYDVIITDLMMPHANGLEIVSRVRKNHTKKHVGIIVVSSMGHEDMVTEAFSLGADDYLKKPIMAGELLSRLKRLAIKETLLGKSDEHIIDKAAPVTISIPKPESRIYTSRQEAQEPVHAASASAEAKTTLQTTENDAYHPATEEAGGKHINTSNQPQNPVNTSIAVLSSPAAEHIPATQETIIADTPAPELVEENKAAEKDEPANKPHEHHLWETDKLAEASAILDDVKQKPNEESPLLKKNDLPIAEPESVFSGSSNAGVSKPVQKQPRIAVSAESNTYNNYYLDLVLIVIVITFIVIGVLI